MKKSILNLNGALELSKNEQKSINGGISTCTVVRPATSASQCYSGEKYVAHLGGCAKTVRPCPTEINDLPV